MKQKILLTTLLLVATFGKISLQAQTAGWPENYGGVMLQGFYWDSFTDSKWTKLEKQADDLATYFDLIWIPQSGQCAGGNQMGYMPLYYFTHNSSFGTESELRHMIETFRNKGLGTIADVVINHRDYKEQKVVFPSESYHGATYQMTSTDICRNDDGGSTLTWANNNGYQLSSNNDTGEDWSGARDLDHKSSNVNKCVKAYLNFLLNDLGYIGFRYDMVKGYSASFTADYNTTAKPTFSVGECWDGTTTIKNWINGTKVDGLPTSAAFDFQFRYRVRDAINGNNWSLLSASKESAAGIPLIYDKNYQRWAVTFVENHDTEYRSSTAQQDPIKADTLAANAFLLAMPGTPCVFYKHWLAKRYDIKPMIAARKLVGITNQSEYEVLTSQQFYYAVRTTGTAGSLLCVVGKTPKAYTVPSGYKLILSGTGYCYYISEGLVTQWNAIEERIQQEYAKEQEEQQNFKPHTATIYVRDELGWNRMNYYIWDNKNSQLNGSWPGKQITQTKEVNGHKWYYQTFNIDKAGNYVNVVFSTGTGSPQTVDVTEVDSDTYFIIRSTTANGKYLVEVDEETTGIATMSDVRRKMSDVWYTLDGRKLNSQPTHAGIYISNGRKIVVK